MADRALTRESVLYELTHSLHGLMALVVVALCASCLAGWLFGVKALTTFVLDRPPMAPMTALTLLVGAVALACIRTSPKARALAVAQIVAGLTILLAHLAGVADSRTASPWTWSAPPTGAALMMSGSAAVLLVSGKRWQGQMAAFATVLFVALLGLAHLFPGADLYEYLPGAGVSIPTTVAFLVLSFGQLVAFGESGIVAALAPRSVAGRTALRLLLATVLAPVVLCVAVVRGYRYGLFDGVTAVLLVTWSAMALLVGALWRFAVSMEKAEGAKERAEQMFRAYLLASATSMYRMSPDWNEMRRLDGHGFLSDTVAPRADWLRTYIHPEDQPLMLAKMDEAIRTKTVFDLEHRVRLADGSTGWIHSRAVPITDEHGELVEWFGVATDVTERKRLEDALRASEERFRSLYEAQHTAHLVLSPDLIIEDASAPYLEATMRRKDDLVGKRLFEAFPDNPREPNADSIRNLAASLAWVLEHRRTHRMPIHRYDVQSPSGKFEQRWWAPLSVPVLGPDGAVRHIIHQVEDVTAEMRERQQVAEARAGEARLRQVADAIPGLVFETDAEARNVYVNEQYCLYTGRTRKDLLGDAWREVFHPDDRERKEAAWREAAENDRSVPVECRVLRADGVWRWFILRVSVIRDAEGRVERGIGVFTDIDDSRRAQDALRESEQQFRDMAEALPQLAWMADEKGWIYWYNRRWYEYTGCTEAEMVGSGWRKVHHPDHVERVVAGVQRSWDSGEAWEDTFPLRGADGQYRWFLSRAVPLHDSEGRVIRWFGTNTDITEHQRRENFQRTLLHEVSHRVKNSLAIVSGLLDLQARSVEGAARLTLEDASARVRTVATVHAQLWPNADRREIDLASFLSNLAAAIATSSPRHNTSVDVEPADVSADAAVPIGLLVNELVTNAYKHAYASGEEGEVSIVGKRVAPERYQVQVLDHGRGLPSGFDLHRSQGTLGMRVITSLTSQLRGELTVGSASPGARFTIQFPIGRAE